MTHKFTTENWQNLLPQSYNWLKNELKVHFDAKVKDADLTIVAVQDSQDSGTCKSLSSFDLSDAIDEQLKTSKWSGNSNALSLSVSNKAFAALTLPKVKTAQSQLSRQWGMNIAQETRERRIESLCVVVPKGYNGQDILEGIASGYYSTSKFTKKKTSSPFPQTIIFSQDSCSDSKIKEHLSMAKASAFTRFLQDAPPNWMDTEQFAAIAKDMTKELGYKCKVYGEKELAEEQMHLFLSVSRGSVVPAQMIVIEIKGKDSSKRRALVGKGLTFDAGGLSLKPSAGMVDMKYDMSGGAAVFGAAHYLSEVKPATDVIAVIACAENMPSAHATKPSDIIKARNGKSVEILNTDAEGRLVLADALNFTSATFKPEFMLDAATLTGAVIHALGHNGGALMSNDQDLADKVLAVSKETGEPFWQLPLWPEMDKDIKGAFADLANIAKPGVMAGTIIGGIFLREFVEKTPWVHLDVAGVSWNCKATGNPTQNGSGYAVRTMANACMMD